MAMESVEAKGCFGSAVAAGAPPALEDAIQYRHLETTGMFTGICVWEGGQLCVSMWCVGLCGVYVLISVVWVYVVWCYGTLVCGCV